MTIKQSRFDWMGKFVANIGDDRELWKFAILAVRYAQLRARKRGFQGVEAACESYIKTMRAVSGQSGEDNGEQAI